MAQMDGSDDADLIHRGAQILRSLAGSSNNVTLDDGRWQTNFAAPVEDWLAANQKSDADVMWGRFPLGMVKMWMERAEKAESELAALRAQLAEREAAKATAADLPIGEATRSEPTTGYGVCACRGHWHVVSYGWPDDDGGNTGCEDLSVAGDPFKTHEAALAVADRLNRGESPEFTASPPAEVEGVVRSFSGHPLGELVNIALAHPVGAADPFPIGTKVAVRRLEDGG
jgi:hypothetical protein